MSGWGAEQLTREELLNLGGKLHRGWDASLRQANRGVAASQMSRSFAVASEICQLWGELGDELIVRGEARVQDTAADREAEAGS